MLLTAACGNAGNSGQQASPDPMAGGGTTASAGSGGVTTQASGGPAVGGAVNAGAGEGNQSAGAGAGGTSAGTAGVAATAGAAGAGGLDLFPTADCAPGAIFCDGFEEYPEVPPFDDMGNLADLIKIGDTEPTWLAYHFHGPPRVDSSKPFSGLQDFHLDTETGHTAAADIILEGPDGQDLWPDAHYGRFMLWLKDVPPSSPFGLMSENGLLPGSNTEVAQFTLGGLDGKLAFLYTQRARIYKNDASAPDMRRGGNDEMSDPGPDVRCAVEATTEALPPSQWVCVEWMVDRATSEMHVWLDGVAQPEADVMGGGSASCDIGTADSWTAPEHFTELVLGFEMYGDDSNASAWEAWFDDFAVGRQRLGCPMQ